MRDVVDADAGARERRRTPRAAIAGERHISGRAGDEHGIGRVAPAAQVDAPVGGDRRARRRARGVATSTAAAMSTSITATMYFVYG